MLARKFGGWFVLLWAVIAASAAPAASPDWPQFRGPDRSGLCMETGLLKQWPEGGPKLLWKAQGFGRGYSTVAIVGDRLYTMGDREAGAKESQYVVAFDLAAKQELWTARIGPPHSGGGPRSTPTVNGARLYAIGTEGDLACLETATGKVCWTKSFAKDFGGRMMSSWKYSESPLVDGEKVVCTPGGKDATIVALGKKTGDLIWKCAVPNLGRRGADGAGYSSIVAAEIEGVRQYVQLVGRGLVGVDAKTGKLLWGYNRVANDTANITSPVVKDNYVFSSTVYGTGSGLVKITKSGDEFKAEEVYFLTQSKFSNHHGGVVLVGDYLYGGDGQNRGAPACIDFKTGKVAWKERALGGGSAAVLFADGNLIFRYEKEAKVVLVEANPKEFKVKGTFKAAVADGESWAYPVVHAGKLYLRLNNTLMCYDVSAKD